VVGKQSQDRLSAAKGYSGSAQSAVEGGASRDVRAFLNEWLDNAAAIIKGGLRRKNQTGEIDPAELSDAARRRLEEHWQEGYAQWRRLNPDGEDE